MSKDTIETVTVSLEDLDGAITDVSLSDTIDITNMNMTTTLTNLDDDLTVVCVPSNSLNPDRDPNGSRDLMGIDVDRFLRSLLDPEMFGHAVTAEVRDEARALLGLKRVETVEAE